VEHPDDPLALHRSSAERKLYGKLAPLTVKPTGGTSALARGATLATPGRADK